MGNAILVGILTLAMAGPLVAADLYVSSDGDDGNPGTKVKPFASMAGARAMPSDV
ncbi:MAG: hypothetical protein ACE5JM_07270 [Armatimonadota bacterium]